jgi:DNA ligase-1
MKTEFPILYKRSNSKDNINQWQIEVDGNKFRTTSGFVGMKLFTGDWTECVPKNEGKKNNTTSQEQALSEAQSMYTKRKDLGYWEDINDCDKKVYFSPMLAAEWSKTKSKININNGVYSDPKLDGIRCIVKSDGLWTRNGKEIISAPHIYESLKHMFDDQDDLVLDGELYADKDVCDFNTIVSCVRKTKPTQDDLNISKQYIKYWIYDCPSNDGLFNERKEYLSSLKLPDTCVIVESTECKSESEIDVLYKSYMEQGFEGQMIRTNSVYQNKRSKFLLKRKEFFDNEYKIIGYNEGIGKLSGKVGALILEHEGKKFDCAVNGTHDYLQELWLDRDNLIGKMATVKYFEITTDGSPRFPKCIAIRDYE